MVGEGGLFSQKLCCLVVLSWLIHRLAQYPSPQPHKSRRNRNREPLRLTLSPYSCERYLLCADSRVRVSPLLRSSSMHTIVRLFAPQDQYLNKLKIDDTWRKVLRLPGEQLISLIPCLTIAIYGIH
ncbi:hypothetical protein ES703_100294 [subsurface metagenome]